MEYVKYAPEQNVEVHVTEMRRKTFTKSALTYLLSSSLRVWLVMTC